MDYPIMLYLGGLTNYAIAHDEDEADDLQERGYVTHAEAMKLEQKTGVVNYAGEVVGSGVAGSNRGSSDELAEAYEHIEAMESAIEVKDRKILELTGEIEDKDKVIAANHEHIDTLRSELAELTKQPSDYAPSYDDMEKDDLKALLDERGVKYVSRDNLDDLIQKAKDSE